MQYLRGISVSGMRLDASQLSTLCVQLSSLNCLTSLHLSNNVIDLTPHEDDHSALNALCSLLSALPALSHLDLSGVSITGCLYDILTSIDSAQLVKLELSELWLSEQDLTNLQKFQQKTAVTVILN